MLSLRCLFYLTLRLINGIEVAHVQEREHEFNNFEADLLGLCCNQSAVVVRLIPAIDENDYCLHNDSREDYRDSQSVVLNKISSLMLILDPNVGIVQLDRPKDIEWQNHKKRIAQLVSIFTDVLFFVGIRTFFSLL